MLLSPVARTPLHQNRMALVSTVGVYRRCLPLVSTVGACRWRDFQMRRKYSQIISLPQAPRDTAIITTTFPAARPLGFAGTPVAIAITVRLRLCPPKPSASLHPGASRHPFTWPWAAMGSGGHSLQPSSFRFDCTLSRLSATAEAGMKRSGIDRPGAAGVIRGQSPRKSALSSLRPRLAEATAVRALAIAIFADSLK